MVNACTLLLLVHKVLELPPHVTHTSLWNMTGITGKEGSRYAREAGKHKENVRTLAEEERAIAVVSVSVPDASWERYGIRTGTGG